MKIRAAVDYERADLGKQRPEGAKHAFDVYLLLAMLDPGEWERAAALATVHTERLDAVGLREGVAACFGTPDHPACRTILREAARVHAARALELERFCASLGELFGADRR